MSYQAIILERKDLTLQGQWRTLYFTVSGWAEWSEEFEYQIIAELSKVSCTPR